MKTPREILLKQHQSIERKLDRLWVANLSKELRPKAVAPRGNVFFATIRILWCELVLPSRRIWAGLVCAWLLIAVLNLASFESSVKVASKVEPPSREKIQALVEQRRMLAQLIGPLYEPANAPKHTAPGPRSERPAQTTAA